MRALRSPRWALVALAIAGTDGADARAAEVEKADVLVEALAPAEHGCLLAGRTERGELLELVTGAQLCSERMRERLVGRWMEVAWSTTAWEICDGCDPSQEVAQLREIGPSRAHEPASGATGRVVAVATALAAIGLGVALVRLRRERRALRDPRRL